MTRALFDAFDVAPVPLHVADVLVGLQTGVIDGVYASPLALITLQWFSRLDYRLDLALGNASGALVMGPRWEKFDPDLREILLRNGRRSMAELQRRSRADNAAALDTLSRRGISTLQPDARRGGADARIRRHCPPQSGARAVLDGAARPGRGRSGGSPRGTVVSRAPMTQPPAAYIEGYEKARALNPDLADAYVEHTLVGDPLADAAMESLAEFDREKSHRLINAGMQGDDAGMREAPDALKELFSALDGPSVVDFNPALADPGSRAFYKYSDMFFVALVLEAVITGFTTGVSKSFYTTGRTAGNLRRLRQNTRHMVEITLPGGMERHGDGWKLTVRIRLIHAQLRRMLLKSNAWDVSVDGLPLHMSHRALAATGFSAINLQSVRKLGVRLTEEESLGFMHIWHYVTWLLGVPKNYWSSFAPRPMPCI